VLAGLVAAIFPGMAGVVGGLFALWIIAFYSILFGIAGLPAATALAETGRRVLGIIAAVLSILFGIVLIIMVVASPGASVLSLIWVVGVYAIVFGVTLIILAITTRASVTTAAKGA